MNLQPLQDAGKIRNWAKVERYGYQEAQNGQIMGRVDTSYGMMILTNNGQTTELYATTEKEAHIKAVEFVNGL